VIYDGRRGLPCTSEWVDAARLKSDFALDKGFVGLVASLMERISRHEASIDLVFLSCDAMERRSSSILGLLGEE
jgi:hypothetical protein